MSDMGKGKKRQQKYCDGCGKPLKMSSIGYSYTHCFDCNDKKRNGQPLTKATDIQPVKMPSVAYYRRFDFKELLEHTTGSEKSEIFDFINTIPLDLNLTHGPWVAGGSVRRAVEGQKLKTLLQTPANNGQGVSMKFVNEFDIDIFCRNEKQYQETGELVRKDPDCDELRLEGTGSMEQVLNFVRNGVQIQLIGFRYHTTVLELLDAFCYTITQFATDGKQIIYGKWSLYDLAMKRLTLTDTLVYEPTPKMIKKYLKQDFRPWLPLIELD